VGQRYKKPVNRQLLKMPAENRIQKRNAVQIMRTGMSGSIKNPIRVGHVGSVGSFLAITSATGLSAVANPPHQPTSGSNNASIPRPLPHSIATQFYRYSVHSLMHPARHPSILHIPNRHSFPKTYVALFYKKKIQIA
jgi:hypothetical protein